MCIMQSEQGGKTAFDLAHADGNDEIARMILKVRKRSNFYYMMFAYYYMMFAYSIILL
jgi:hypothetical protein